MPNVDRTRWTHTARLLRSYPVGAEQFGEVAAAGTEVVLYKDPTEQVGDRITFRLGRSTGVAFLRDLADVEAVEA